jgi:hypothetical protein
LGTTKEAANWAQAADKTQNPFQALGLKGVLQLKEVTSGFEPL